MSEIQRMRVAIAGEALIDLISEPDGRLSPCLGGAVYNLSRALARQGIGTLYLNPFSSDTFGQALMQQMLRDGVALAQALPIQAVTSLAVVNLNHEGYPSYAFYREGVADRQVTPTQMNADCEKYANSLDLACIGALALDPRDQAIYLPWLIHQKHAGRCIVVDANLRPSVMPNLISYRQCVQSFLNVADIIKVSDEDLISLGTPGNTPLQKAQHLLKSTSAKLIALTLGAEGAWLLASSGATYFAKETKALNIIDTVGAGDSFLAGLIAALASLSDEHQRLMTHLNMLDASHARLILNHAIASASLCVQERGCVPPTWDQTTAWVAAHHTGDMNVITALASGG